MFELFERHEGSEPLPERASERARCSQSSSSRTAPRHVPQRRRRTHHPDRRSGRQSGGALCDSQYRGRLTLRILTRLMAGTTRFLPRCRASGLRARGRIGRGGAARRPGRRRGLLSDRSPWRCVDAYQAGISSPIRFAISSASASKTRYASLTVAAWLPMAPSAALRSNTGLRASRESGSRLRKWRNSARQ